MGPSQTRMYLMHLSSLSCLHLSNHQKHTSSPVMTSENDSSSISSATAFDLVTPPNEETVPSEETVPLPTDTLKIHPLRDGIIISINTPREPEQSTSHVPCDIVLVIDVSGSMKAAAPIPATESSKEQEDVGLSVLDLVKHSARTIIEILNDEDRLGIVTYSNSAEVGSDLLSTSSPKLLPVDKYVGCSRTLMHECEEQKRHSLTNHESWYWWSDKYVARH